MKRNLLIIMVLATLIMAGCTQTSSTSEKVMKIINTEQYTADNIQQISSLITDSKDLTKPEADSLYLEVGNFIRLYAEHLCDSLNERLSDTRLTNEQLRDLLTGINALQDSVETTGVEIIKIEGEIKYDISPIFLADMFRNYISKEEYEFAEIEQVEFEMPISIDEELTISYQDIADRLWACDHLMDKAKENQDIQVMVKPFINTYVKALMYGAENTPNFDWGTGLMLPEAKDALLSYVNDHPDAYSATVLNQYIDVLKKSKFYDCRATRQFYFKYLREN